MCSLRQTPHTPAELRAEKGTEARLSPSRPTSRSPLPPVMLHLLKVLRPPGQHYQLGVKHSNTGAWWAHSTYRYDDRMGCGFQIAQRHPGALTDELKRLSPRHSRFTERTQVLSHTLTEVFSTVCLFPCQRFTLCVNQNKTEVASALASTSFTYLHLGAISVWCTSLAFLPPYSNLICEGCSPWQDPLFH